MRSPIAGWGLAPPPTPGGPRVAGERCPDWARLCRDRRRSARTLASRPRRPASLVVAEPAAPPPSPDFLFDHALTAEAMAYHTAAIDALRECVALAPGHAAAWLKLAELLRLSADDPGAEAAEAAARRARADGVALEPASPAPPPGSPARAERRLRDLLQAAPPEKAMTVLRDHLGAEPRDAAAMRLLARLEKAAGDMATSWRLLRRALELRPGYIGAREDLAHSLTERRDHAAEAVIETRRLMELAPGNPRYRELHANALVAVPRDRRGRRAVRWLDARSSRRSAILEQPRPRPAFPRPAGAERDVLSPRPGAEARSRRGLVGTRRPQGRRDHRGRCRDDARPAGARRPGAGQPDEHALRPGPYLGALRRVRRQLRRLCRGRQPVRRRCWARGGTTGPGGRGGAADEGGVQPRESGGRLPRATGMPKGPTPIFIVGMPRAGSTLVEQILASHSLVEGTRELPLVGNLVRELGDSRAVAKPDFYPERLLELERWRAGRTRSALIAASAAYRSTDRPFFIDKRPWNWLDAGLIHLMLPGARIVDIRREPMAACFSMFKQILPPDAAFSYDFADLGGYLQHLRQHDGALAIGDSGRDPFPQLRAPGGGHRNGGAQTARLLRSAVRGRMPQVLGDPAHGRDTPAPSRCAARSSARGWSNGGTSSPGSAPCGPRLPSPPTREPAPPAFFRTRTPKPMIWSSSTTLTARWAQPRRAAHSAAAAVRAGAHLGGHGSVAARDGGPARGDDSRSRSCARLGEARGGSAPGRQGCRGAGRRSPGAPRRGRLAARQRHAQSRGDRAFGSRASSANGRTRASPRATAGVAGAASGGGDGHRRHAPAGSAQLAVWAIWRRPDPCSSGRWTWRRNTPGARTDLARLLRTLDEDGAP